MVGQWRNLDWNLGLHTVSWECIHAKSASLQSLIKMQTHLGITVLEANIRVTNPALGEIS